MLPYIVYQVKQNVIHRCYIVSASLCFLFLVYKSLILNTYSDIDECQLSTTNCQHGSCIDDTNGYTCVCVTGYTGTLCETGNLLDHVDGRTDNFYCELFVSYL